MAVFLFFISLVIAYLSCVRHVKQRHAVEFLCMRPGFWTSDGWFSGRTLFGLLLLLVAFLTMVSSYQTTACQAQFNKEFRDGLIARAAAQADFQDADAKFVRAQRSYLNVVAGVPVTEYAANQALADYKAAIEEKIQATDNLAEARKANPYLAADTCPGWFN